MPRSGSQQSPKKGAGNLGPAHSSLNKPLDPTLGVSYAFSDLCVVGEGRDAKEHASSCILGMFVRVILKFYADPCLHSLLTTKARSPVPKKQLPLAQIAGTFYAQSTSQGSELLVTVPATCR